MISGEAQAGELWRLRRVQEAGVGKAGYPQDLLWPEAPSTLTWALESGLPLSAWEQPSLEARPASAQPEGLCGCGGPSGEQGKEDKAGRCARGQTSS